MLTVHKVQYPSILVESWVEGKIVVEKGIPAAFFIFLSRKIRKNMSTSKLWLIDQQNWPKPNPNKESVMYCKIKGMRSNTADELKVIIKGARAFLTT